MLTIGKVLEIQKLLSLGMSQRRVASKLGVARATVGAIASDKRGLHGREESSEASDDDDLWPLSAGDFVRCPECGAKALLPCVSCNARRFRRQELRMQNRAMQNRAA